MAYELILRYTHCHRDTIHVIKTVDTMEEARQWLELEVGDDLVQQEACVIDDTGRECPVTVCSMRLQKPKREMREVRS